MTKQDKLMEMSKKMEKYDAISTTKGHLHSLSGVWYPPIFFIQCISQPPAVVLEPSERWRRLNYIFRPSSCDITDAFWLKRKELLSSSKSSPPTTPKISSSFLILFQFIAIQSVNIWCDKTRHCRFLFAARDVDKRHCYCCCCSSVSRYDSSSRGRPSCPR